MNKLVKSFKQFLNNEEGMGAVEYALIVAVMSVIILAVWGTLQGGLQTAFTNISDTLQNPSIN